MPETILDAAAGRVRCEHTKVAIIGANYRRDLAPWEETASPESWCWWALNEIPQPRMDRHFELHPMEVQSARELAWLAACTVPCYLLTPDPRVPSGIGYPLEWVLERTGGRRYFTCTFAFQIALALAEGFKEIGLWGVDLDLGTARERLVEKPCVEYWLGLAEGRGVNILLPSGSTLLSRDFQYGYDYHDELAAMNRVCDEMLLTIPVERWPPMLQRIGNRYGGHRERALARAAAELGWHSGAPRDLPPR